MARVSGNSIREVVSKKYLDWAEALPRFQSGPIHELQRIREDQRSISDRRNQNRSKPEDASITLNQIRIIITFQFEDFNLVRRAVGKLFPNSDKASEFVKNLKNKESSINSYSWGRIGFIAKEKRNYLRETQYVDELPEHVKLIDVCYHRIMSSLAFLSFSFHIEERFSESLAIKQNHDYLPPVVFKSINPFKKFPRGYFIGSGGEGAREIVGNHVLGLFNNLNCWLQKATKLTDATNLTKSVVEYYAVNGNPNSSDELGKWLDSNRGWLGDYRISVSEHDSYRSNNLIYCSSSYPNNNISVYNLVLFEGCADNAIHIDTRLRALSVNASLFSSMDSIQDSLEKYRRIGFLQLSKSNARVLKDAGSASRIKRLGIIINRISHEFNESRYRIAHLLDGLGDLETSSYSREQILRNNIIENFDYRLGCLSKAYQVVDIGITGYLEVQNIYVMHRLQTWMLILSIVATFATIVGVAANWDDLHKLWGKASEMHNK
jgi:hypothetical protein